MQQFHLTYLEHTPNNYSIYQGAYYSFIIYYPELDLTNWTLQGQIRKTITDEILTSFNFKQTIYGEITGKTGNYSTITAYLNATQTAQLPITKTRTSIDMTKEGVNVFVYDIEAIDPNNSENVLKLIGKSWLEVIGEVTR